MLTKKGQSPFGEDQDDRIIMPIGSLRARVMPSAPGRVEMLIASATDERTVDRAVVQIEQILRQRHNIDPEDEPDFGVRTQISNLGSNALIVFARSARASGARNAAADSRLSELDVAALTRESTSIKSAAPFLRSGGQVIFENQNAKPSIIGTRVSYFEIRNWKPTKGEIWSAASESVSEKIAVIGSQTAKDLSGSIDPVGRMIRIGRHQYRVLGVLEEKGPSPFGQSQDEIVLIPITTMRSHILVTRPFEVHAIIPCRPSAASDPRAKESRALTA